MSLAEPQALILMGDNVYPEPPTLGNLRRDYALLRADPVFTKLCGSALLFATWDDHDYGLDDGGAQHPWKAAAQTAFLDFLDVAPDDPRRTQEGVYSSWTVGPPSQRVQVILLDTRYHRSAARKGMQHAELGEGPRGPYVPNTDPQATMLGADQWAWLEERLKEPAQLRLLVSSVQVLATEHHQEGWANFPLERERLFDVLRRTAATGVILLSGDRHQAEVSRLAAASSGLGYDLREVTSSSLNKPRPRFAAPGERFSNELNSLRVGLTYAGSNFGLVRIDWSKPDPVIRIQVRTAAGDVVLQERCRLSDLGP